MRASVWPVAEILTVSLRPSTHLAASKMLAAATAATVLFSLPDHADDSETHSSYFSDRPLRPGRRGQAIAGRGDARRRDVVDQDLAGATTGGRHRRATGSLIRSW